MAENKPSTAADYGTADSGFFSSTLPRSGSQYADSTWSSNGSGRGTAFSDAGYDSDTGAGGGGVTVTGVVDGPLPAVPGIPPPPQPAMDSRLAMKMT